MEGQGIYVREKSRSEDGELMGFDEKERERERLYRTVVVLRLSVKE